MGRADWGGLRNKSLNLAASPPGAAPWGDDAIVALPASPGVDHSVANAIPAFPDWQMNCRRVKEISLIESDLDL
jgi:hypothetical protein